MSDIVERLAATKNPTYIFLRDFVLLFCILLNINQNYFKASGRARALEFAIGGLGSELSSDISIYYWRWSCTVRSDCALV